MKASTFNVIIHEWLTAFRRPSFLFFAFGIPLIFLLIFTGIRLYQEWESPVSPVEEVIDPEQGLKAEGYVDYSGIITEIPPDLPEGILMPFENEQEAKNAIRIGTINAYYSIPEDYVQSGQFTYVKPEFSLLSQ